MNTQTDKNSTQKRLVQGVVRAKLNSGFVLRLANGESCYVPIKYLIGYTNEERFLRYDSIGIGGTMEVMIIGISRRPTASEVDALEYRAESALTRGASVEFYVVNVAEEGVAVRLLSPQCALGQSAYIHRAKLEDDTFEALRRECQLHSDERVGRIATVVSVRRNERSRLSVKLVA